MTTFLLNKMCLENEKKSGKRRFTTFFQKTTVLLLPNWIIMLVNILYRTTMAASIHIK